jgi:xylulokinase
VLVLGLDLGTQSLKAVVCDERLAVRGEHAVDHGTQRPTPDRAEQDPRAWEAGLGPAIGGALARAGAPPEAIAAIAIVGQLDGCVAVDAAGRPLHPALIWQDRRAVDDAARVDAARVFALTGQVADASHMAPKIAWLRRACAGAARFHQPVSYLVERLTGASVLDPCHASTTMLVDLATGW